MVNLRFRGDDVAILLLVAGQGSSLRLHEEAYLYCAYTALFLILVSFVLIIIDEVEIQVYLRDSMTITTASILIRF